MLNPFRIKSPVGLSYNLDEDDVLRTKRALSSLGHYKDPKTGATPWPDTQMFEGLKSFQKNEGLKVDGLMKPKGPTEKALQNKMAALGIVEGGWSRMRGDRHGKDKKDGRPAWSEIRRPSLLEGRGKIETPPLAKRPEMETGPTTGPKPATSTDAKDVQVAFGPGAAFLPLLLGSGLLAAGGGEFLRKETEKLLRGNKSSVPPLMPAKPEPPLPPSEPPKEKNKLPDRTEFPAASPDIPDRTENLPMKTGREIEAYPELDEKLKNAGLIVESKGNPITKAELDRIRDYYLDLGWEHIAGGRDKKTGEEMKEYWIGGPGQAFPKDDRKPGEGDGRKGGKRTDLTFRRPDGKIVHIQSVDVDKNGNPTQREQDNAYRIWLRTEDHDVVLHPKFKQIERLKKRY